MSLPFFYRRVTNVGVCVSSDLGKRLAVVITNFQDIGIGDDQLRLGRNLNLLNSLCSCLLNCYNENIHKEKKVLPQV
jgi:hypothetical protein